MPSLPVVNDASLSDAKLPDDILREASAWLARVQERPLTGSEEQDLLQWRSRSPDHGRAWRCAEQLLIDLKLIPPEIANTTLQYRRALTRRRMLKSMATVGLALPAGAVAYRTAPWQRWMADHHTGVGERRVVVLSDGTVVRLNTASAIDLYLDAGQRLVKLLAGEIHIETAPDSLHRAFFVETAHGRAQALGTRFVVHRTDDETRVSVLAGKVALLPGASAVPRTTLEARQQAGFNRTAIGEVTAVDESDAAWVDGTLFADDMPLPEFLERVSRYRAGILRCDPSARDIRVSGAFQIDDPDRILLALERTRPVTIVWRTRYWGTVTRRSDIASGE